jgi:hypothetical protein
MKGLDGKMIPPTNIEIEIDDDCAGTVVGTLALCPIEMKRRP